MTNNPTVEQERINAEYRKKSDEAEASRSLESISISGEQDYRLRLHVAHLEWQVATYRLLLTQHASIQPVPPIIIESLKENSK